MFQRLDKHFKQDIEFRKKIAMQQYDDENSYDANFPLAENPYKVAKKVLSDSLIILKELGYWCFNKAFKKVSEDLMGYFKATPLFAIRQEQRDMILDYLNWIQNDLLREIIPEEDEADPEKILEYSSSKVVALMKIFKENEPEANFHSILFVQTKVSVFWIDDLLESLKQLKEWSFIRSGFIYGESSGESKGKTMNVVKQKEVLDKFRHHEINILVATNIVEEGVEIPACNVVIRFSRIPNFGSFVQSKVTLNLWFDLIEIFLMSFFCNIKKGRARSTNSKFYIMADEDEFAKDYEWDIKNFCQIEDVNIMLLVYSCKNSM